MAISLIYIDSSLYLDSSLTQMIERRLEADHLFVEAIYRIVFSDIKLIDTIQNTLDNADNCLIVASYEAYPLVSRILATLNSDTLIATDDTLHPASAAQVSEKSFLLQLNGKNCNLMMAKSGESIPEILLKSDESLASWQLFGREEHLKKAEQYARDNQLHFEYFQQIDGWYTIKTESIFHLDKYLSDTDDALLIPTDNIFDTLIEIFGSRRETISFAESCTGGLIASSLTARSGSSDILNGSVISYANHIKHRWLKVNEDILKYPGAVSSECVREMAEGAMRLAGSDMALATSGIAGPTGGTPLKPVGTVFIAAANRRETKVQKLFLKGDRNYIQYQAMMYTIKLLISLEKKNFEKFFKNP